MREKENFPPLPSLSPVRKKWIFRCPLCARFVLRTECLRKNWRKLDVLPFLLVSSRFRWPVLHAINWHLIWGQVGPKSGLKIFVRHNLINASCENVKRQDLVFLNLKLGLHEKFYMNWDGRWPKTGFDICQHGWNVDCLTHFSSSKLMDFDGLFSEMCEAIDIDKLQGVSNIDRHIYGQFFLCPSKLFQRPKLCSNSNSRNELCISMYSLAQELYVSVATCH